MDQETSSRATGPTGLARTLAGAAVAACLGVVWAQALAVVLRGTGAEAAPPQAWALPVSVAAVLVSLAASGVSRIRPRYDLAILGAVVATTSVIVAVPGAVAPALALIPVAVGAAWLSHAIASRLPRSIDALPRTHRWRSAAWLMIAVVAVVQLARLSTWIADPHSDWSLTTEHPFWAKHECLSAYVYGGELALRGEDNVYDASHYPGLNPDAAPTTTLQEMTVEDPFQYAPQFLLWPTAALAITNDYPSVRAVWFALQTTLFFAVIAWLGLWVGGRSGRLALSLWPLAVSAFPALHALQYGQFHLAAIALSVASMLAIDRGRNRAGGALLAVATLSKIFPGVLLVVLFASRRWSALAWTAAFAGLLTAASLVVLGPAPFTAFFEYHLPRLQSGEAFAFGDAWPEVRDMVIAANHGIYGLVVKLGEMGLAGATTGAAAWINRGYGLAVLVSAWAVGRQVGLHRQQQAVAWLALLGLASMTSTGAFVDYVPLTATWLLTLLAWRVFVPRENATPASRASTLTTRTAVLIVWASQYTLFGTVPLGDYFDPKVMLPLSALSTVITLFVFGMPIYRLLRRARVAANAPPTQLARARMVES
ncbi:MAG: glycosyltransferase family 87 protein [Myxococcota bacterium]